MQSMFAGRLAFRLEHFTDPNAIPTAAKLSKPAILAFFQTGMCSQPPQHLSEARSALFLKRPMFNAASLLP